MGSPRLQGQPEPCRLESWLTLLEGTSPIQFLLLLSLLYILIDLETTFRQVLSLHSDPFSSQLQLKPGLSELALTKL